MKKLLFTALGIGIVSFASAHAGNRQVNEGNYFTTNANENTFWNDHGDDHDHGRHRGWYKHGDREDDQGERGWRGRDRDDDWRYRRDCDRRVVYYPAPPVYYPPVVIGRPGVVIHAGVTILGR